MLAYQSLCNEKKILQMYIAWELQICDSTLELEYKPSKFTTEMKKDQK